MTSLQIYALLMRECSGCAEARSMKSMLLEIKARLMKEFFSR